jgi:nitroimidazol reductase NimA-like FMN-containing flavoprotein (pyridoxamine 5'-phosphate oxidase superfamily)
MCVTVSLLDGLVMARSVFNHSMNYRSVVIVGTASELEGAEKERAMWVLTEHIVPGRWDDARRPNESEFKGTLMLAMPLDEMSVKIRTGPPEDEDEDYDLDVWAGVIPLGLKAGPPLADPRLAPGIGLPPYLEEYPRR